MSSAPDREVSRTVPGVLDNCLDVACVGAADDGNRALVDHRIVNVPGRLIVWIPPNYDRTDQAFWQCRYSGHVVLPVMSGRHASTIPPAQIRS
jgi:hypothetical protein